MLNPFRLGTGIDLERFACPFIPFFEGSIGRPLLSTAIFHSMKSPMESYQLPEVVVVVDGGEWRRGWLASNGEKLQKLTRTA